MNIDIQDIIAEIQILIRERDTFLEKVPFIVAVDGKSGGGKTTLASVLFKNFGGIVLHMDDFFLRAEQRTVERLAETGGNVDYERFLSVLEQVQKNEPAFYQPYDCKSGSMKPASIIQPCEFVIVEGSYSLHPYFGDYARYKIGMDIEKEEQERRILERNGPQMLQRFLDEWIPKENKYLEEFRIYEKCDLVIKNNHFILNSVLGTD